MRILVTGSAGFIASKVSEKLLSGGVVVGIDNLNDYYDVRLKEWRLRALQSHRHFTFIHEDITHYEIMESLFATHQFEAVFNLAARAGVRASVQDPWIYYDTNVKGTLNLLECCKKYNVNNFVLASTSSVYGETEIPFKVENRTDAALSPYAASKKAAEVLCHSYHYLYGINISIPRYFTVYGPAGRPDMSCFRFMVKIDRGAEIDVYGDGTQARDFTYVDDIAEATAKCLKLSGYNIFNVGNDRPVELMKMIRVLERLLGKKARINFLPRHPADSLLTCADLSTTQKLLNWRPEISLEKGLANLVNWYSANKDWVKDISLEENEGSATKKIHSRVAC